MLPGLCHVMRTAIPRFLYKSDVDVGLCILPGPVTNNRRVVSLLVRQPGTEGRGGRMDKLATRESESLHELNNIIDGGPSSPG